MMARFWLWFLIGLVPSGAWAQYSPELPWEVQRQRRQNAVRATIRDYDSRLQALYGKRIEAWQKGFLDRRDQRLVDIGQRMAKLAAQIRDRREVSWETVGKDRQYRAEARKGAASLLQAKEIRAELATWSEQVEQETRLEMLRCFQQIIASDLGLKFDEKLRGKVQQAVRAIPVEQLVGDQVSQEKLVLAIQAGLPGVVLTDEQKESIALAAAELARRGTQWVAVTQLQMPPDWAEFLSGLAAMGTAWAAARGLEWIDRSLTGEPEPDAITRTLREALDAWSKERLSQRLQAILRNYRFQVLEFVQAEGEAAAKAIIVEKPR